jgi:alpha-ketoglutaric semialdehyde dehydrogenase
VIYIRLFSYIENNLKDYLTMLTGKNILGYSSSAESDKIFTSTISEDGHMNTYSFHEASAQEIDIAVSKANTAFETYRQLAGRDKAVFLEKIASAIASAKDNLVAVAMQETKLAKPRLEGEVQRTINQAKLFAELLKEGSWVDAMIDTAQPERLPLPKPDLRQCQIALGPVAVFGASNFPFAFSVAGGDTISALAAGCTVVYKAHPGHPATSELVGKIIMQTAKESDLPDGVFSLLQGHTNESGAHLVRHSLIKAVAFTGSFRGGKALYDIAAKRNEPVPVYAEMGSINPVFILPDMLQKNEKEVAEKLALSNMLGAGQFCTNPGMIVSMQSPNNGLFFSHFASYISAGSADAMLTANIYDAYEAGIKKIAAVPGVKLIASGKAAEKERAGVPNMFQTEAASFLSNKQLQEEIFGPASIHIVAENKDQLAALVEQLPGQLTISIWATENDLAAFGNFVHMLELKAGRIIYNSVPTGVEVSHAMVHGGPYPATTDSKITSVGTNAIYRFTRPVCYQNLPQQLLPAALQNENPLKIWRKVNGDYTKAVIE